jgi:hypothetical protein
MIAIETIVLSGDSAVCFKCELSEYLRASYRWNQNSQTHQCAKTPFLFSDHNSVKYYKYMRNSQDKEVWQANWSIWWYISTVNHMILAYQTGVSISFTHAGNFTWHMVAR